MLVRMKNHHRTLKGNTHRERCPSVWIDLGWIFHSVKRFSQHRLQDTLMWPTSRHYPHVLYMFWRVCWSIHFHRQPFKSHKSPTVCMFIHLFIIITTSIIMLNQSSFTLNIPCPLREEVKSMNQYIRCMHFSSCILLMESTVKQFLSSKFVMFLSRVKTVCPTVPSGALLLTGELLLRTDTDEWRFSVWWIFVTWQNGL